MIAARLSRLWISLLPPIPLSPSRMCPSSTAPKRLRRQYLRSSDEPAVGDVVAVALVAATGGRCKALLLLQQGSTQ